MKKLYEIPALEVLRLDIPDSLTSEANETLSGIFDYGEGVEEW